MLIHQAQQGCKILGTMLYLSIAANTQNWVVEKFSESLYELGP